MVLMVNLSLWNSVLISKRILVLVIDLILVMNQMVLTATLT